MKFCPKLPLYFAIAVVISCSTPADKSPEVSPPSFEGHAGDACFDRQMEVWMERFHLHQQNGLSMFEADEKARREAIAEMDSCRVGKREIAKGRDGTRKD